MIFKRKLIEVRKSALSNHWRNNFQRYRSLVKRFVGNGICLTWSNFVVIESRRKLRYTEWLVDHKVGWIDFATQMPRGVSKSQRRRYHRLGGSIGWNIWICEWLPRSCDDTHWPIGQGQSYRRCDSSTLLQDSWTRKRRGQLYRSWSNHLGTSRSWRVWHRSNTATFEPTYRYHLTVSW